MPSFDVDPVKHKTARTQEKIRTRALRGSTESEQSVAKNKLRRPEELPKRFPKLQIPERAMTPEELNGIDEAHWNPVTKMIQAEPASKEEIEALAAKARTKKKVRKPQGSIRKTSGTFKPSSREEAQANKASWSDYWSSAAKGYKEEYVNEKIDVGADVSKTISDFVHSKSKTFKGDSKKQRIKRALGAYYAAQKEETENIYNYIIETLVDAEYAADYEAAEVMFENISTEFTAVLLEQYLEEKARGTKKKSTVHAYDVDETLFAHGKGKKPNVKVHVKDESGKRVQSLTNQEFNTHKLKPGHKYDFGEFQSAKKFRETSTPNKKVVKHIQRKVARGENVHLITARSKFDNPKEFHAHLQSHGIDIPMKNVHYTGGMKGGDVGDKKVAVANAVAKQHGASKVHMYDDAPKVHKSFEGEKKQKPTSMTYKTHLIKPDKGGESKVRSYQATKEEMSSYEYWKQFIK